MNAQQCTTHETALRILRVLIHSGKLAEIRLDGALGSTCLSATRLLALRSIGQADTPLALGQLAARLAFVKSNVTQLVDRLEAEGLVQRLPDPEDRRCTLVRLTEAGQHEYQSGLHGLESLENDLIALYTSSELQQLISLLERLGTAWT